MMAATADWLGRAEEVTPGEGYSSQKATVQRPQAGMNNEETQWPMKRRRRPRGQETGHAGPFGWGEEFGLVYPTPTCLSSEPYSAQLDSNSASTQTAMPGADNYYTQGEGPEQAWWWAYALQCWRDIEQTGRELCRVLPHVATTPPAIRGWVRVITEAKGSSGFQPQPTVLAEHHGPKPLKSRVGGSLPKHTSQLTFPS